MVSQDLPAPTQTESTKPAVHSAQADPEVTWPAANPAPAVGDVLHHLDPSLLPAVP